MRLQRWNRVLAVIGQVLDLAIRKALVVPIALERDQHRRRLMARVTGVLTIHEALVFLRTARADSAVETWPLLFDTRGATTDVTPEDVEYAVATVDEIRRRSTVREALSRSSRMMISSMPRCCCMRPA